MAFTISSTFESLKIGFHAQDNRITGITAIFDGDSPSPSVFVIQFRFGYKLDRLPATEQAHLTTLQEIYASANGFRNENNSVLTPSVTGFPYGNTVEDLAEHGYPNPLDADSFDQYQNKLQVEGYATRGLIKAKTVGGREQVEHGVDFVTADFTPKTENYNYPMRRWLVYEETSTQFWVELLIPKHHAIDSTLLNNYPPILAFKAWLADIKESGPDVGSDVTNSADLSIRNYDIPVSGGTLRVRYGNRGQSRDSDSEYRWIRFRFDRQSTGSDVSIDSDDLRDYFQGLTISLASADITVPVELGDYNAVHKFQRHDIDENRSVEYLHNTILYHGEVVRSGRKYTLPIGPSWGIGLSYGELAIVNTIHQIPFVSDMNAVHFFGQSANGVIRIPNPRTLVRYRGTDRQMAIHNIDTTYNVEVQDWNGDQIVILMPGEHFEFRITLDQNGRSGRMIDEHIPERVYEDIVGDHDVGDMDDIGYLNDGLDRLYVPPLISTTTDNPALDPPADAFEGKTATFTSGAAMSSRHDLDIEQAVEVLQNGELKIEAEWECIVEAAGTLALYSAPRIYSQRGTAAPVRRRHVPHQALSGIDRIEPYIIGFQEEVEKGDTFSIIFRRHASSSLGMQNFRLLSGRRRFTLKQRVQIDWSA